MSAINEITKLKRDYERNKTFHKRPFFVFFNICFWMVIIYRLSRFFSLCKIPLIPKIFWLINRVIFNVEIHPKCKIGGGLVIRHGSGLVVGENTIIEDDVTLYHGVTLGGNLNEMIYFKGNILKEPYLSKGCIIFTGSILVGPMVIPEDEIIKAGSLIVSGQVQLR